MSSRTDSTDLGILLTLALEALKRRLHAHLASSGFDDLGPAFGYVFRMLDGDSLSLVDVARRLGMTSQGALKIAAEMETKGYVQRTDDPDDGRVRRLTLAPRGIRALREARKFYRVYERELGEQVGARKVVAARAVLAAMVRDAESAGLERVARPF
jgi:DNA-binding MarR family transcriptional regulator